MHGLRIEHRCQRGMEFGFRVVCAIWCQKEPWVIGQAAQLSCDRVCTVVQQCAPHRGVGQAQLNGLLLPLAQHSGGGLACLSRGGMRFNRTQQRQHDQTEPGHEPGAPVRPP